MAPGTPSTLFTALGWDLPLQVPNILCPSSTWHRVGASGVSCCPSPWGLKLLSTFYRSGRLWMHPLFSLFPLFPSCTLLAPMWEMLGRAEGFGHCFCVGRHVDKLWQSCVVQSFLCNLWELPWGVTAGLCTLMPRCLLYGCPKLSVYNKAINSFDILLFVFFFFLRDYYDLDCFSHDSWEWQVVTH